MEGLFTREEASRLDVLRSLNILDTQPEYEYDCIVALAAKICSAPMATISLVDGDRQWFKATVGIDETGSARELSFCQYTILSHEPLVVCDALQDERFSTLPFVTGPMGVRFYCGVPIHVMGKNIGALCAVDRIPREASKFQVEALEVLANLVASIAYKDFLYLQTKAHLERYRSNQTAEPAAAARLLW